MGSHLVLMLSVCCPGALPTVHARVAGRDGCVYVTDLAAAPESEPSTLLLREAVPVLRLALAPTEIWVSTTESDVSDVGVCVHGRVRVLRVDMSVCLCVSEVQIDSRVLCSQSFLSLCVCLYACVGLYISRGVRNTLPRETPDHATDDAK